MKFSEFLNEAGDDLEKELAEYEHFVQHIAEEELISCKITSIRSDIKRRKIAKLVVVANCNDKPRKVGYQKDLSEKLARRLERHPYRGIAPSEVRVCHLIER